jgi:predicted DNA-binding transcriptional regulator YafY
LADRLGVTTRTLRRDVDRIRSLGYRVDSTAGVAGGYRLGPGSQMPPMLLDDDDAVAIAIGLRMAAGATIEGIDEGAVSAMAKLEQVVPDRVRRRIAALHQAIETVQWQHPEVALVDGDALVVVAQACRDREELRFDYRDRVGTATSRLVQPYQLVTVGRRWYLVAWDLRRADWRTFRVDRLARVELAGGRFVPRELPAASAADFVARSLSEGRPQIDAVVVVHDDRCEIRDALRWIHHEVEPDGAGGRRIRLRSDSIDWLVTAVAQLAVLAAVTVVSPDELVERIVPLGRRLVEATGSA